MDVCDDESSKGTGIYFSIVKWPRIIMMMMMMMHEEARKVNRRKGVKETK